MTDIKNEDTGDKKSLNFIEQAVEKDLKEGKNGGKVQTRFPPEPNGYLHIGHAKAICLDFGMAASTMAVYVTFVSTIQTRPKRTWNTWRSHPRGYSIGLATKWGNEYYASDYFQQLWDFAIRLIEERKSIYRRANCRTDCRAERYSHASQECEQSRTVTVPIEESLRTLQEDELAVR